MLVLAVIRLQNGELESDESWEEEPSIRTSIDGLRASESLDLAGSYSARDRRRSQKPVSI